MEAVGPDQCQSHHCLVIASCRCCWQPMLWHFGSYSRLVPNRVLLLHVTSPPRILFFYLDKLCLIPARWTIPDSLPLPVVFIPIITTPSIKILSALWCAVSFSHCMDNCWQVVYMCGARLRLSDRHHSRAGKDIKEYLTAFSVFKIIYQSEIIVR